MIIPKPLKDILSDLNPKYLHFLKVKDRECIIYGGAGAGKSYACAQKILLYCLTNDYKKILVLRKTLPALKLTSLELILSLLNKYKIPYEINKADLIITTYGNNRIIFRSIGEGGEDIEKIKSITDIDMIWLEETTEINEKEYNIINLRLRGQKLKKDEYRQIMMSFNPVDRNHWIYKNFFEKDIKCFKEKYTYKDNKFIDEEYKKVLENLKYQDEYAYQVYCLGEWGVFKGQIYSNYKIENFENNFDEVIAGIDFGYNNPSAYVLIGIKDNEVFIFDEIYRTHLTTPEFIDLIKEKNKIWDINPQIYCETEPDRNRELEKAGLNVYEAKKDVILGINFVKTKKLHIHERCLNTIKEIQGYKYKEDRNSNVLEEPVKFNDHLMDAMRYALYTHFLREQPNIYVI